MADYTQYQKTTYAAFGTGQTPTAAQLNHFEDGLAALSAQIVVVTAQVADLTAKAAASGKYATAYPLTY